MDETYFLKIIRLWVLLKELFSPIFDFGEKKSSKSGCVIMICDLNPQFVLETYYSFKDDNNEKMV